MIRDVGILGLGLWQGEPVENSHFGSAYLERAQVKDPYKGQRDDQGKVRIAGLELDAKDYGRTIAVGPPAEVRADPAVVEAYLGTPEGVEGVA